MRTKKRIFSVLLRILSAVVFFSSYSFDSVAANRKIKQGSPSEAHQRIESLKKSLVKAKGDERLKIIKKIAEIENKILEKHLSSSAIRH